MSDEQKSEIDQTEDENEDEALEFDRTDSPESTEENTERKSRHHCDQCGRNFSHNAGLYNHMRRKHGVIVYTKASILCREPNCEFRCSMRDKLQSHLVMEHQKPLAFSTLKFSSMKEFDEWKEVFEKQEKCRFVKKSGTRLRSNTGEKHSYLYCSRSGTFVSNSKGKRVQMRKGTCKISNYCTASIDCIEDAEGKVIAKLCSTHYGHEPSVEYLRLTKSDKTFIADKLAQGIPRDVLIDNVRASVGENLDRVHFLTMKDIRNIERSYGIKQDIKQKGNSEGFTSVSVWVNEMDMLGEESPVVFYKGKNAPKVLSDNCDCLEITDFCLVLMTRGQQEIFKKFGQNGVFYLTWLKVNSGYDLSLLTLMVADDLNEAFPIAYMICSRTTTEIETLFFKVIREKLGSFCARAIMTDDKKSLYDSWCAVMGFVPYHLLSNRFVDADWRDRLITVQNEDVQCAVYEVLYSYLSCTDSSKFEENLKAFIKHLKENNDTNVFGLYFEDNYLHRVRLWAGCYDKKSVGVNEHLNLDIVYYDILAVCNLKGKFARMMDKTLQGLLTIVRDRQHKRIIKITKQVQELNHHHEISKNINLEGITEIENRKWQIKSESSTLIFTVTRKTYECSVKCALVCPLCKVCAHMFECTCKVYNFDRTMCKHIHSIGRLFQKGLNVLDFWDSGSQSNKDDSKENVDYDTVKNDINDIKETINETDNPEVDNITDKKSKVGNKSTGPFIVVAHQNFKKSGSFGNRIRSILQSLADDVSDVSDPIKLRKIFIKLKKVKNFVTGKSNEVSAQDTKVVKKRGRPKLIKTEEKPTTSARRPGRPKKIRTEDEQKDNHVGPRNLQEIIQQQLLEERIIIEEVENAHENSDMNHSSKSDDIVSSNENNKPQEIVKVPKKRGRKPKPKPEPEEINNEEDDEFIEPKRIKMQDPEEKTEKDVSDVSTIRKSKRSIKKKQLVQYEYFHKEESEFKRKSNRLSSNTSKEATNTSQEQEINDNRCRIKRANRDARKNEINDSQNNKDDRKSKSKFAKFEGHDDERVAINEGNTNEKDNEKVVNKIATVEENADEKDYDKVENKIAINEGNANEKDYDKVENKIAINEGNANEKDYDKVENKIAIVDGNVKVEKNIVKVERNVGNVVDKNNDVVHKDKISIDKDKMNIDKDKINIDKDKINIDKDKITDDNSTDQIKEKLHSNNSDKTEFVNSIETEIVVKSEN